MISKTSVVEIVTKWLLSTCNQAHHRQDSLCDDNQISVLLGVAERLRNEIRLPVLVVDDREQEKWFDGVLSFRLGTPSAPILAHTISGLDVIDDETT